MTSGWYHVDDDVPLGEARTLEGGRQNLAIHLHLDLTGPDHFDMLATRFGPDDMIGDALRTLIEECAEGKR